MDALNAHEELLWNSEIAFGVLGRNGSFVLLDMALPLDEAVTAEALAKGYAYCGILAVTGGRYGARFEPEPDCMYTMLCASIAAAHLIADRLWDTSKGDSVNWLRQLYSLPDMR